MIFFTADCHFNHEAIIRHCKRPFANIGQMNEALIRNWNQVIKSQDVVYILGDLCFGPCKNILKQLNGNKNLIPGNHDKVSQYDKHINICKPIHEIKYNNQKIVLCHYRMYTWDGKEQDGGAWHLYGHSHGAYDIELLSILTPVVDVGVDSWNFTPVSFTQIKKYFKDKIKRLSIDWRSKNLQIIKGLL